MKPVAPVNIAPGATGAWTDADLTTNFGGDAGSVAGIVCQAYNASADTAYHCGWRKNGSTDDRTDDIGSGRHIWFYVGVDSSDIVEFNIENTDIEIYLRGYYLNSEAVFFTNSVSHTVSTADVWEDWDISSETNNEPAKVAFFDVDTSGVTHWNARRNGEEGNPQLFRQFAGAANAGAMAVDSNEILELQVDNTSTITFYLMGYQYENVTIFDENINYGPATKNEFVDVDHSADVPEDRNGVYFRANPDTPDSTRLFGIRNNGSAHDVVGKCIELILGHSEVDTDRIAEVYTEEAAGVTIRYQIWGYTSETSVADVSTSLDAKLQGEATQTASLDAKLQDTETTTLSLDALLKKQAITATASLDAVIFTDQPFKNVELDARIALRAPLTCSLSASIQGSVNLVTVSMDAVLKFPQRIRWKEAPETGTGYTEL